MTVKNLPSRLNRATRSVISSWSFLLLEFHVWIIGAEPNRISTEELKETAFSGFLKGLFGTSCRNVGKYGMEVVVGPARLCRYYECELRCEEVVYDECGFPINPYTCKTAQLVPLYVAI